MSSPQAETRPVVLELRQISRHFVVRGGGAFSSKTLRAVDRVSLDVRKGETVAVVGESGSGKSTLGRCAAALLKPTSGEVLFRGVDVGELRRPQLRRFRRDLRVVFQDHAGSLNPRKRVASVLETPLKIHGLASGEDAVVKLLADVELSPMFLRRYPHELSGGQRQRVAIARAIATQPEVVVLDEPLSALDVSVQAQICNLLSDLQEERGLAYLFISHDLGVVRQLADRVVVLYLGRAMEVAAADQLYSSPRHPYTRLLLDSIPSPERRRRRVSQPVAVESPGPRLTPSGCPFSARCPRRTELCVAVEPPLLEVAADHFLSCHHPLVT